LPQVADHFGVEKADRQPHQFDKKIRNKGDADTGTDMKHYPTPDKSNGSLADHQDQLCNQYQYDETEVIRGNSNVYNGLCQKREQKAQEAAGEESEQYLKNQFPVWPEITEEKSQPVLLRYFSLFPIKIRGGFDQQSDTCRFPLQHGGRPVPPELLHGIFNKPGRGIRNAVNISLFVLSDPVKDNKVILAPVKDGR
jgi:beta-glucosidase-like glycosyl hydrolase